MDRRTFLLRSAEAGLVGVAGSLLGWRWLRDEPRPFDEAAFPPVSRSPVAVLPVGSYDGNLEADVLEGLRIVEADVQGKVVLLKPNLVEFDAGTVINTDPRLVGATVLAMRRLGARDVIVGEGPGHRRDTEYVVTASGLFDALAAVDARFVDLNVAPVVRRTLASSYTTLGSLMLPEPVVDADVVVSMPKMKAHHWAGVTLSLKNCFGCVPGRVYGWPKNVLHWQNVQRSILDVAAAVRPDIAIIDGVVGMEGDGPINGTPVRSGVIIISTDPVAADATASRLMGVDGDKLEWLTEAGRFLGQARLEELDQRGDDPERLAIPFSLVDTFAHLRL